MELLFESRSNIISTWGKLYFVQEMADVLPEPVLVGDSPADGTGVSIYGTVLRDGGIYRMWYQAWPRNWSGKDASLVGYAESDDGLTWRKPRLALVDFGGTDNNLCNLGMHSPSVFIDPAAPASHRYRATGFTGERNEFTLPGTTAQGYFTAHSADGLCWELDQSTPQWPASDVITSIYHPRQQRAIVSLKRQSRVQGIPRRAIWQAELRDGVWSADAHCALAPDDFDDVCAHTRGFLSGDYYGMGMLPAGQGAVGFLWQFRHRLPLTDGSHGGIFGACDISLTFQEGRGDRWLHAPGRRDFISHQAQPWTRGGVYSASTPVEVGDEQWLFITGATQSHGWYLNADWQRVPELVHVLEDEGIARIGVARWKKDRLFGYRADPQGGCWLDLGEINEPCELALNYKTEANGSLRVKISSLLPMLAEDVLAGREYADGVPLTGDSLCATVAWKNGAVIHPVPGRHLTAYVEMDRATLYGYALQPLAKG